MNANKNIDKRIIKTKIAIKTALVKLLEKKKVEEISIVELTNLASVNRKTFYLHYSDVDSVIKEIENDFFKKMEKIIRSYDFNLDKLDTYLYSITKAIVDDNYIHHIVTYTIYRRAIMLNVLKIINDHVNKNFNQNKTLNFQYILDYNMYGSVNLLNIWLLKDTSSKMSIEELSALQAKLIRNSFSDILN